MKIKQGYGYWDTTNYPIGGNFHRVNKNGLCITEILRDNLNGYKGCTHEGRTKDNKIVAFNISHTE